MREIFIKLWSYFVKQTTEKPLIVSAITIGAAVIILVIAIFLIYGKSGNDGKVVLSKNTVDELVDKAANQKYLQKVFEMPDKLPLGKHTPLKPVPEDMQTKHIPEQQQVTQRCSYKGQTYVAGDIVKTDQGWVRCTPTIIFSDSLDKNNNPTRQSGAPAWAAVQ